MLSVYKFQKIDSILFYHFLSLVLSRNRFRFQKCPAPSVLMTSMPPNANPFAALLMSVPRLLAAPVMKLSFAGMTSLLQSVCFAIHPSLIRMFNISDLPRLSSRALSPSTSRIFSSLRNRPCFLPLKLPSPLTGPRLTSMHRSSLLLTKLKNFKLSISLCGVISPDSTVCFQIQIL